MLQFEIVAKKNNGDDIETGIALPVDSLNIAVSGFNNPTDFLVGNRFRRVFVAQTAARFYFNNYQFVAILGNVAEVLNLAAPRLMDAVAAAGSRRFPDSPAARGVRTTTTPGAPEPAAPRAGRRTR